MRPRNSAILAFTATALLLAAGCSKQSDTKASATADAASVGSPGAAARAEAAAGDAHAPGLTTSAAPGVAFDYRYDFTLPAKAISGVQRQHATACERLGPTRCQITGMSYQQPAKDEASARLDFLLAPDIAQQFASDALSLVERADGELANASVNGENAGGAIEESQRQSATMRADLARIEKRLMIPGLSKEERTDLSRRADDLRGQLRGQEDLRKTKESSLATTPVSFAYASEGLFSASGNPLANAAKASWSSLQTMLAFVLTFTGLALPWLLLGGLAIMAVRMRRMKQRMSALTAETLAPAGKAQPAS